VQKVRFAVQSSDKQSGESEHPLKLTVTFYVWCAAVWKANDYLPLSDSEKFKQ